VNLRDVPAPFAQGAVEAVMLPLALAWEEGNRHRARCAWPAPELVASFVEILRRQAIAAAEAEVAPHAPAEAA